MTKINCLLHILEKNLEVFLVCDSLVSKIHLYSLTTVSYTPGIYLYKQHLKSIIMLILNIVSFLFDN